MARPVKDTPILEEKAAERFDRMVKENENKLVSSSDYNRARETFERIKKNSPSLF